jgi:hypothetical protein
MKNEKLNKDFAYPAIFDLRHEETFATHRGLTKLELISAMCLQGLLGCQDGFYKETRAKYAIQSAKELLKQLEEIQEDTNK